MDNHQKWKIREIILAAVALVFVLFLQGTILFLMISTLGQAVWTMGYATSFTHDSFFTIYAQDFGIPKPAAIAFGLAGAWPCSGGILLVSHNTKLRLLHSLKCWRPNLVLRWLICSYLQR